MNGMLIDLVHVCLLEGLTEHFCTYPMCQCQTYCNYKPQTEVNYNTSPKRFFNLLRLSYSNLMCFGATRKHVFPRPWGSEFIHVVCSIDCVLVTLEIFCFS